MKYLDYLQLNLDLTTVQNNGYSVIDLFAGCGGLALGFEASGFETIGYEMLKDACQSYSKNLNGECHCTTLQIGLDLADNADVIIGGPPCQPFSVMGDQRGPDDPRDGFPIFLDAVKRYQPKVALFENVRGLLYRNRFYFEDIISKLANLKYNVEWKILNAVQYGVPQMRERLFVVAHRGEWSFPRPVNEKKSITAGEALGELAYSITPDSKFLTPSMDRYIAVYEKKSCCIRPRDLHLNAPSRTVTCRNLNGATSDMLRIRLPDGRRRRLTVREAARLQSFPDWFVFCGNEGSQFNQIGNAVPPLLSKALADSVLKCLESSEKENNEGKKQKFSRQERLNV
jgi:DNA (cytosine-5)-methyltransferase 1